jgi:hypothetical protein
MTSSASSVTLQQGGSGTITLTALHRGSFNSSISFTTSGLPSTVSAALSSAVIAAPGDGSTTVTLQAFSTATPATYSFTVLAQGGGLSLKIPIAVQVTAAPAFTFTSTGAVMTLHQSGKASIPSQPAI